MAARCSGAVTGLATALNALAWRASVIGCDSVRDAQEDRRVVPRPSQMRQSELTVKAPESGLRSGHCPLSMGILDHPSALAVPAPSRVAAPVYPAGGSVRPR